jgi:hypothetical protein
MERRGRDLRVMTGKDRPSRGFKNSLGLPAKEADIFLSFSLLEERKPCTVLNDRGVSKLLPESRRRRTTTNWPLMKAAVSGSKRPRF